MRRTTTATHSAIGTATLILLAVLGTGVASAHSPVAGAFNEYAKNTALTYKFAATTYPAWVYSVANGTLTSSWPSSTANNSASPRFTLDATSGTGTVEYRDQDTSPCSGNFGWAQCSANWGTPDFKFYIRNLETNATIRWYDDTTSCPSGKACYYARRGLIHEVEHVALSVYYHDSPGEANTVMGGTLPANPTSGWNTTTTQRCDASALQLWYDTATSSGPYAACFDHIPGHGTVGLISTASVGAASYFGCTGTAVTATGRLAIKTDAINYKELTNNPLTGRTVLFDRRPVGGSWTLGVTSTSASSVLGNNWTKAFTSGSSITYEFRIRYTGEAGVDPSNQPTFTITWSTSC